MSFFFFNDTATTEIYTLSLHDALPIFFGYDSDTPESFRRSVDFAREHRFYIAAFNHLTPFPGTPLYARLASERRLLFDRWWLDERYRYNMVPFTPAAMTPAALQRHCLARSEERRVGKECRSRW